MRSQHCLVCRVHADDVEPPGGVLVRTGAWAVAHKVGPNVLAGQLVVTLLRHCERLADLTDEEAVELGPLLVRTVRALEEEVAPERVHVGSYGEGVRHVHVLVTPRLASMPPGNGRTFAWLKRRELQLRLRLRRPVPEATVVELVGRLRARLTDGKS